MSMVGWGRGPGSGAGLARSDASGLQEGLRQIFPGDPRPGLLSTGICVS